MTNDEQHDLITDASDYERVTGEHPVISAGQPNAWLEHYEQCALCQTCNPCAEGVQILRNWAEKGGQQ